MDILSIKDQYVINNPFALQGALVDIFSTLDGVKQTIQLIGNEELIIEVSPTPLDQNSENVVFHKIAEDRPRIDGMIIKEIASILIQPKITNIRMVIQIGVKNSRIYIITKNSKNPIENNRKI